MVGFYGKCRHTTSVGHFFQAHRSTVDLCRLGVRSCHMPCRKGLNDKGGGTLKADVSNEKFGHPRCLCHVFFRGWCHYVPTQFLYRGWRIPSLNNRYFTNFKSPLSVVFLGGSILATLGTQNHARNNWTSQLRSLESEGPNFWRQA